MKYLKAIICFIAAVAIQGSLPSWFELFGGKPDAVIVVLIAFSLAADPASGALFGFFAGLVEGSAVGLSLGSFIITRTIAGFIAGVATTKLFNDNPIVSVASALWLTLLVEILFLIANPASSLSFTLLRLLGECILNSALSLVLYIILHYVDINRKIRLADIRGRF